MRAGCSSAAASQCVRHYRYEIRHRLSLFIVALVVPPPTNHLNKKPSAGARNRLHMTDYRNDDRRITFLPYPLGTSSTPLQHNPWRDPVDPRFEASG